MRSQVVVVSSSCSPTVIRVKYLTEDNTDFWTGGSRSKDYYARYVIYYFTLINMRLLLLETTDILDLNVECNIFVMSQITFLQGIFVFDSKINVSIYDFCVAKI